MTILTKGMGKVLKEVIKTFKTKNVEKIRPGGDTRGFPLTNSKGSVIKNPQDKFSEKSLKTSKYHQDLKRFNEGISDYDPRKGKK